MALVEPADSRRARVRAWFSRSSQVFLLGLIIACGIEVVVDWNTTFLEIGVLRDRVAQRGLSYVSVLARSSSRLLKGSSKSGLTRLTDGVFDDPEVAFVRFTDEAGAPRFDRIEPQFAARFRKERQAEFGSYYGSQLTRDVDGILHDPAREQEEMADSRYRDTAQRWNDLLDQVGAFISGPPDPRPHAVVALFQDAVRNAAHGRDDAVTWAFAAVEEEGNPKPVGAVLVAFDMARTNSAIRLQYLKGIGMVVFFVGLILVQNISSRRDKLRLLELEARHTAARAALRRAMPGRVVERSLVGTGELDQAAEHVEGMLVDVIAGSDGLWLLVLDPNGDGLDAAASALHIRAAFRGRRSGESRPDLAQEVAALGAASHEILVARPTGLMVAHVSWIGEVRAVSSPIGALRHLGPRGSHVLLTEEGPAAPAGVIGPLTHYRGNLGAGDSLLAVCGGLEEGTVRVDVDDVAVFVMRAAPRTPAEAVGDALAWARGRTPGHANRDLVVAAIERPRQASTERDLRATAFEAMGGQG